MIALGLARALGVRGTIILACLLVLVVTAYGVAQDLGLVDPPARAKAAPTPAGGCRPKPTRAATADIPRAYLRLYCQAGARYRIPWPVSRPKSDAGIRELPLAPLVIESIRRQLPLEDDPDLLVFTGPGGGNGVPVGSRTMLSRYNFRRVYQHAVTRASRDLVEVDPHGPHDLRHSFSTWLEDAGIPARVIDELMGHERSRRGDLEGGSRIGARYRHTTPEMAVRVAAAIQQRLEVVVQVAEAVLETDGSDGRVF